MKELTKEKQLHAYYIYFSFEGEDDLKRFFVVAYNRKTASHIFRVWATAKGFYHRIKADIYLKIVPKSKINKYLLLREQYDKQIESLRELFKEGEHHD